MALGPFYLPSEADADRALRFKVNLNYVQSLSWHILDEYGPEEALLSNVLTAQRSLPGFQRIRDGSDIDLDALSRLLRISWASELQLRLGQTGDVETLRYSNMWAPVHAYYAIYMSMQAWFTANKVSQLVDNHSGSLRTISNHVTQRGLFPTPWAATAYGCPQLGQVNYRGLPQNVDPNAKFEVLSTPSHDTYWPRFCTLLRTTRERRLERNFRVWKESNHRKNMKQAEKIKVSDKLADTTIFDFFWRLRVRSNYKDVSSFLTWSVPVEDHADFRRGLIRIVDCTCTLLEALIVKAGLGVVRDETATEFLSLSDESSSAISSFVSKRQHVLSSTA